MTSTRMTGINGQALAQALQVVDPAVDSINHAPGVAPNAIFATSVRRRTARVAQGTKWLTPDNGAAAPGTESTWTVSGCGAFLRRVDLAVTLPTIGGRADPASSNDNVFWCDDAGFKLIEWAEMIVGCNGTQQPREYGIYWKFLHDRLSEGKRHAASVFNLPTDARIRQSVRPVVLNVPLLFDFAMHHAKALWLDAFQNTPLKFRLMLRNLSALVERLGAFEVAGLDRQGQAQGAGGQAGNEVIPTAFGESQHLVAHTSFLTNADAQALQAAGQVRTTQVRAVEFTSVPHASGTAVERVPIDHNVITDSVTVIPQVTVVVSGRTFGDNRFDWRGADQPLFHPAGSTDWVQDAPFAGLSFILNGNEHSSFSYQELTDYVHVWANRHARNPTDDAEKAMSWLIDEHNHHAQALGTLSLNRQNGRTFNLVWSQDGHSVPNWDGDILFFITSVMYIHQSIAEGASVSHEGD